VFSVTGRWLGTDGHLYYEASAAWLSGGNPWDVFVTNRGLEYHYYALPTAAVLIAPFTKIPEDLFVAIWIGIQVVAAVYVVWRLKLQWWWLAFPPLVDGILAGNPSPLVIALLVAPHPAAKAFAVLLKVYAGLPLLGERKWRAVLIAAGIVVASVLLAPGLWAQFIDGSSDRTARQLIEAQGGFSAFDKPVVLAGACLALALIARRDLRVAGWLAPIAIWPGSQFHWSTLAMPVMTLPMAYLLALPGLGLPPLAVMLYAAISEVRHLRARPEGGSSATIERRPEGGGPQG